jgi:UDP-2,3-diacylglucosamine hydrolase
LDRSEKDWIFVSDAHLTGREPEGVEVFLRFLDSEKERMGHLVILGDLFEFLFGFQKPSPFPEYLPIFEELQHFYHQGIRIQYFEGNHDFFLRSFFSQQLNMEIEVHPDGCEEHLQGRRVFIAHGDLSNPSQWRYRAFRRLLKNRWTFSLIELAGPSLSLRVARGLGDRSYQKYHHPDRSGPPSAFKTFAHQKFLEGFEVVILGHSHFPDQMEEEIEGRKCLYFNVGDWMTRRSFLRFTPPEDFRLERFTGVETGR